MPNTHNSSPIKRSPKALGQESYPPVSIGALVSSLATLTPDAPANDGLPHWRSIAHQEIAVRPLPVVLESLDLPGDGAALVLLANKSPDLLVLGTYGVSHGGNGAEVVVADHWIARESNWALVLLRIVRESRSWYSGGVRIESSPDVSWAVVGATSDGIWLAFDERSDYSSVHFESVADTVRLIACKESYTDVFNLEPTSALFQTPQQINQPCNLTRKVGLDINFQEKNMQNMNDAIEKPGEK